MLLLFDHVDRREQKKALFSGGKATMDFLEGFEEFTDRRARKQGAAAVSVQARGSFGINNVAYEALGSPERVILLYNAAARLIAFKPIDREVPHAYPVRPTGSHRPNVSSWVISSKSFFDRYDIDYSKTRSYEMVMRDGIGVIDLNNLEVLSNDHDG